MLVDVVLLPRDLSPGHVTGRTVVAFDVLRATTTMTAALAAGVTEIRAFATPDAAAAAASEFAGPRLTCGERGCLPVPGFDLGNSPGGFEASAHAGRTVFMSTTNGTLALLAARAAPRLYAGALVNQTAVARALAADGLPVTLLCAGTSGAVAMEDLLGAGAVIDALAQRADVELASDVARVAARLFDSAATNLPAALRDATGGRNVIAAGLAPDVEFAAQLDVFDLVGRAVTSAGGQLRIMRV
ncbi:MAG TPA: 2-phosphosulfolactate phosphatase [Tepidisphaeraceae bacterium]|nr:2-phosphosulfolactate phosphatase [Tepidisphaeraceae bacterium]